MNAASLIQAVKDRFPEAVRASHSYRGDATVLLGRVAVAVRVILELLVAAVTAEIERPTLVDFSWQPRPRA